MFIVTKSLTSNHWEIIWRPKNCEHLINQYIKLSLECLGIPVVLFTLRLRWLRSMGLILRRQNLHICFHACSNLLVFFSRKSKPLSCTTVLYSNSKLFSVLIPSHLLSEMFMAAYQKIGSMPTVVTIGNGSLSLGGSPPVGPRVVPERLQHLGAQGRLYTRYWGLAQAPALVSFCRHRWNVLQNKGAKHFHCSDLLVAFFWFAQTRVLSLRKEVAIWSFD